jgi:site-specific recombinase XerD
MLSCDAAGRVIDVHALRHTFGTRLCRLGLDPKTIQTLMRHSTPELTFAIYVHSDWNRLRAAAQQLPPLTSAEPCQVDGRRTGTDDLPVADAR